MAGDVEPDGGELLTAREREVLDLLRVGLTNEEIAGRLGISLDGAKYHVSQIIGKLGVRDRYEAARWPERPPWWSAVGAPVALLWRRAGALLPVKLSSLAAGASVFTLVALLSGLGLIAFLLLRGEDEATRRATPPVIRALAPGEEAPDCVFRPDGSITITDGHDLCFDPREVAVDETVRVTATGWEDEFPVRFYLLTKEQFDMPGYERSTADRVKLGELDTDGGEVSFAFTLAPSFETMEGNTLEVSPGDRLYLEARQRTGDRTGTGSGTGPLVVR